jgi:hypothetical protein
VFGDMYSSICLRVSLVLMLMGSPNDSCFLWMCLMTLSCLVGFNSLQFGHTQLVLSMIALFSKSLWCDTNKYFLHRVNRRHKLMSFSVHLNIIVLLLLRFFLPTFILYRMGPLELSILSRFRIAS